MSFWNSLASWFPWQQHPTLTTPIQPHLQTYTHSTPPASPPPMSESADSSPPPGQANMDDITFIDPQRLPKEEVACWLTSIKSCKWDPKYYIYNIVLPKGKPKWRTEVYVPAGQVRQQTKEDLKTVTHVLIPIDNSSRGICTFCDLVGEEAMMRCYVRDVEVAFRGSKYTGHAYVPASSPQGKVYERLLTKGAKKSIEPVPAATPPRRTVEFLGPIRPGNVRTDVWSLDGVSCWRGGGTILKVEVADGRKHLTVMAPIDRRRYIYLVGDVGDAPFARSGRFEEVRDPETTASAVFELPPWVEEE